MTRRSTLRASDSDRELVAERLRDAASEGRLSAGELEDRLEVALAARTYGQLNSALTDLPTDRDRGLPVPLWARASLAVAGAVGVLTAAALAAMLFALIACASAAWMVVTRALTARDKQPTALPGTARGKPTPPAALPRGARAYLSRRV